MALAGALAAGQSGAATVNIDGVSAGWGSVVAVSSNSAVTGLGTSEIRWGKTSSGAKSGYGFVGVASGSYDLDKEFQIGTFTHFNNPIAPQSSIKATTLSVSIKLMIDGVEKNVGSAFKFRHLETPNRSSGQTCANGAKFGVGVNGRGCADRVSFKSVIDLLEEFQIGDAIYTMQITGFLLNGRTVSKFWTREYATNSANLTARFVKLRDVEPPPPPVEPPPVPVPVPVPASGLLLLAGLGALPFVRRRRA